MFSFASPPTRDLSIVLVCHNMARELPRTLKSLSPEYQVGVDSVSYEVIIVDNGSSEPATDVCSYFPDMHVRYVQFLQPSASPVAALNFGISIAEGHYVCACIDAARMASPGLISQALSALALGPRPVIGTYSFHLGHEAQNISIKKGYSQQTEDLLLGTVDWERDGYQLFRIAAFDPSSRFGLFAAPAESNAVFMSRELWAEYEGFEPAFETPGGGLANLDLWTRICEDSTNTLVMLLGEGTFHQVHGGIATNAVADPWDLFHAEYITLRRRYYKVPERLPLVFGKLHGDLRQFLSYQSA